MGKEFYETPFFEEENEYWIKASLWQLANILLGFFNLFKRVNADCNTLVIDESAGNLFWKLLKKNDELKEVLMNTEEYRTTEKQVNKMNHIKD